MRKFLFIFYTLTGMAAAAQTDSSANSLLNELEGKPAPPVKKPVAVFIPQRLINNANTTEMLKKGHFEFKVVHNFGDIVGNLRVKNAFGLDNSTDIKIGFTVGVTKNSNVMVSRNKGFNQVTQLWEMAFKYRIMQQMENDASRPLSIAVFANGVASSAKRSTDTTKENFYPKTSSRQSQVLQLMIARKFGKIISIQLNSYVCAYQLRGFRVM